MSEVPKIVYDRLRAAQPQGSHPDADVLTAFAEQSLSDGERENVLAHLSACQDCRETIALSFPALEIVAQAEMPIPASAPAVPTHRNWFAWPNMRWATLAAAVVVVASALVLRPGKGTHNSTVASVSRKAEAPVSTPKEVPAETESAAPSSTQPTPSVSADHAARTIARAYQEKAGRIEAPGAPDLRVHEDSVVAGLKKQAPGPARAAGTVVRGNVLSDIKRDDTGEADKLALNVPAAPPSSPVGGAVPSSRSVGAASETVEVDGERGAPAQAPTEERLLAENRVEPAAIQKAKAPSTDEAKRQVTPRARTEALGASSNYAVHFDAPVSALWRLSEGMLQRSIDSGSTWATVLHPDQKLLCRAVRGNEIWAGGQAGTLFHSFDSGNTWTQIHPSFVSNEKLSVGEGQPLTADIVSVEFVGSGAVSFITSQKESWMSLDTGRTWSKKSANPY
jgi:hypothetical protein